MKYRFLSSQRIIKVSPRMEKHKSAVVYANEEDEPKIEFKELVIEEKPKYDEKTQELFSWFEDGKVITQKYKIIDKETGLSED